MKAKIPSARVRWRRSFRIISTRFPPVALFERVADPADWEDLVELESLTNPRVRNEVGEIQLVPVHDRVTGPNASFVMAAFTHIGHPSRFSDGSYGVLYMAHTRDCAIAETVFHWGRFYAATGEPATEFDMRVLIGRVQAELDDIRAASPRFRPLHDPDSYRASQAFGRDRRALGKHGIVYNSVRLAGHDCVAAFRPAAVTIEHTDTYLLYHFDGTRVARYFDYQNREWRAVPEA